MKKSLKFGIIAAFVAMTLTGCEAEDRVDVLSARNVDECISNGMDFMYCEAKFKEAQAMHEEVAPKFESNSECSTQFGESCVQQTVTNTNGTTSSVWMPMMMGYMMGNSSSNMAHASAVSRPLYMSDAKRDPNGKSFTGSMVTASGNSASFGKHSLSKSAAMTTPTRATVSSTRAAVSTRGGFSASARGGMSAAS